MVSDREGSQPADLASAMEAESATKIIEPRASPAAKASVSVELPRSRRVGRYELVDKLGVGGMATVYIGRALGTAGFEKVVAVKVIHPHLASEPEFVEMFLDEARIAARIHHPHVVEILDLGHEDDQFFMAMEYVEGDTLSSLIKELQRSQRRLPESVGLQIIADACEGLAAAHDLVDPDGVPYHVVHRDVSPHNLLVGRDGRVRVVDFGIMKAAGKRSTTLTGQLRGKLPYMSPEQARGKPLDLRTDLFALGVVAWELLIGERLFTGETESEILTRVCEFKVPDIASLHPKLAPGCVTLLRRALAPSVTERYRDAHEMLRDVRLALRESSAGPEDAREILRGEIERAFGPRLDYTRAKLRNRGAERSPRDQATLELEPVPASATEDGGQPSRIPTAVVAGRSSVANRPVSESRDFVELPTSTGAVSAKPARASWILWVLMPLVGAAVGTAFVARDRGSANALDPTTAAASLQMPQAGESTGAVEAAESTSVRWSFNTTPQGAAVIVNGQRYADTTPMSIEIPRGEESLLVRFEYLGYVNHEVRLAPLRSENFSYSLEPRRPAVLVTSPLPFSARTKKGPRKSSAPTTGPDVVPSVEKPAPAETKDSREFRGMPVLKPAKPEP